MHHQSSVGAEELKEKCRSNSDRRSLPQRTLSQVAQKEYKGLFLELATFRVASLEVILHRIQKACS
jgi:hypothetical protein